MRVLFLIPKAKAPTLDGPQFSGAFKDFIALCLTKDPSLRPTAKELLQHRFVKYAKKTTALTDLIERHAAWKASGGGKKRATSAGGAMPVANLSLADDTLRGNDTLISSWSFDTVRAGLLEEEEDDDDADHQRKLRHHLTAMTLLPSQRFGRPDPELAALSVAGTDSSGPSSLESDRLNSDALSASTAMTPALSAGSSKESLDSDLPSPTLDSPVSLPHPDDLRKARARHTTFDMETLKPPSPNTRKRSSYAARHDINGTVLREGDVGNGTHTIRPVIRFDSYGSQRESAEYTRRHSPSTSISRASPALRSPPTSALSSPALGLITPGQAGEICVREVVLPALDDFIGGDLQSAEVDALSTLSAGFSDLAEANPDLAYRVVHSILTGVHRSVMSFPLSNTADNLTGIQNLVSISQISQANRRQSQVRKLDRAIASRIDRACAPAKLRRLCSRRMKMTGDLMLAALSLVMDRRSADRLPKCYTVVGWRWDYSLPAMESS